MSVLRRTFQLTLLSLVFAGARVQAQPRLLDPLPSGELSRRALELQELPYSGAGQLVDDGEDGSCTRKKLTLTVGDLLMQSSQPIEVSVILPASDKPTPVIILVPTIMGSTSIESHLISNFCDMGFATILADVNDTSVPKVIPSWGHEDLTDRHAILSLRSLLDWASTNNAMFDPQRIGLMGASLGAIQSAFLAGLESSRLAGVFLVVGGSNLPGILATTEERKLTELRSERMASEKMTTVEQYEDKLRETMRYDSSYFASLAKTDHLFMVMSSNDSKVPTPYQQEMFEQFGQPSSTTFSIGHVETILSLTYFYFSYVSDFFNQRFGIQPAAAAHTHVMITETRPISSSLLPH